MYLGSSSKYMIPLPENDRDILYRMIGAMLMACSALIVIGLIALLVSGCRQMPVTKGEFHDAKVEQAKVDSKQSDAIASAFKISYGMNGILFETVPEGVRPAVQQLDKRISAEQARADVQAEEGRERSNRAERELESVNTAPDAAAWISGISGMFSGNFSGILELLMGALGIGGLAQAARLKSRAGRMAEKAEMLAELDPETAKKLVAVDEDLAKHRRKKRP
jgi:hypothetical protein